MKVTPYVKGELDRRRFDRKLNKWIAQGWKQWTGEPWSMGVPDQGSVKVEIANKFYMYWWRPV